METQDWPRLKKARGEARTIVFLDESGLSQRPHRARTWAPRGQTPVLTFNYNWKSVSTIAGLTLRNFYFKLHHGAICSPQVIDFLLQLHRHLPGKFLLFWDGAPIHRSTMVQSFLQDNAAWLWVERLPPYAPKLNPVEYLWACWKKNELANFCPKNIWELTRFASQALKKNQSPQTTPFAHYRFLRPSGFVLTLLSLHCVSINKAVYSRTTNCRSEHTLYSACNTLPFSNVSGGTDGAPAAA